LTGHMPTEIGLATNQELVKVLSIFWSAAILDPVEPVYVELTNEGLVLNLRKELGKSLLGKVGAVEDLERSAIGHPRDVRRIFVFVTHMIQHIVETKGKVKLTEAGNCTPKNTR
jgi:hypothetical protein